jgi:hypothetical protein
VSAFVIENHGEIKERFSYEILFNRTTQLSLVAYSQANYGPEAVFRLMTDGEKADFITLIGTTRELTELTVESGRTSLPSPATMFA